MVMVTVGHSCRQQGRVRWTPPQVWRGGRQMVRNVEVAVGIARGVLYAAAQCCVAARLAVCDAVVHAVLSYCVGVFGSTFVV